MTPTTSRSNPFRNLAARAVACAALALLTPMLLAQDKPAPAPAKPPPVDDEDVTELVVNLKDGRRYVGPLVSRDEKEVVIRIAGIPARFAHDEIASLETLEPLMERFRKLKEAVGDDPEQIVKLAEWLQSKEKYELALTEVDRALTIDKDNGAALRLKALLQQQIILKHNRVKKGAGEAAPVERTPTPKAPTRRTDFPVLTTEQVNLIKVYETKFEERPRIIISRDTINRVLDHYQGHPLVPITREGREAILRQSPAEVLDLMFKLQARDFYSQVEVLDQPKSFGAFRDHLQRAWLLNSCATSQCHGGTEAGRLALDTQRPNDPINVYTNFLILSRFRLENGDPLIDWERPERSPLVQLGLPRDKSARPHAEVPRGVANKDAWRPAFHSTDDAQFKEAVDWIKSLYRPRPEYPIPYVPLKPFEPPAKPPASPLPTGTPAAGGPKPQPPVPQVPDDGSSATIAPPRQEPPPR